MAKNVFGGIETAQHPSGVAKTVKKLYGEVGGVARKVVKGYCEVGGVARQFFPSIIIRVFNIFNDGKFSNVPSGLDIENNAVSTSETVSALSEYFNTNKTLWTKIASIIEKWCIGSDKNITSNYTDYNNQLVRNSIYIPINVINNPVSIRITARGNLIFKAGYVSNGAMIESSQGYICSDIFVERTLDVSNIPRVEYIRIGSPEIQPISTLSPRPDLDVYLSTGDPVDQWKTSADGWVQHFVNPIVIHDNPTYLLSWQWTHEEYDWESGQYIWKVGTNGVGLKDLDGEGNIYLFLAIYNGEDDPEDPYTPVLFVFAVSDAPFSAYVLEQEWDSWIEDTQWSEYPRDADSITYFGQTYYILSNATFTDYADTPVSIPNGTIVIDDLDDYFRYYQSDFNDRGTWTAAHIIMDGVIHGGSLHRIKKIEVLGAV